MTKEGIVNKNVFIPVACILSALFLYGVFFQDSFATMAQNTLNWSLKSFNWLILKMTFIFNIVLLFMVFHPTFGKKIIGGPDAKPEYSVFTWISMAICSSIGIAMMFYAVAEPLGYFYNPPKYLNIAACTNDAALAGVAQSTFHWSLQYYGMQIFWGILIVYLSLNKGLPFRPSTALYPLLKDKVFGWPGIAFDVLTSVCLVCGTVTCFGLGTMQFAQGLSFVSGIHVNNMLYLIIVVVVTIVFSVSSARGVKKGMAFISDLNAYLYIALLAFLLFAGPTLNLLELVLGSIGKAFSIYIPAAFNGDFLGTNDNFAHFNTSFYFIWTLVFSPIAGMFYAKIARGRSIRQFIIVNWFVPSGFILLWFSLWGGNSIWQSFFNHANIMEQIKSIGVPVANFALLDYMPLRVLTIPATLLAVLIGFITMTDALTGVVSSLTAKDSRAEEAPICIKLFWGILIGGLTLVCLFVLDQVGTSALQSLAVSVGVPMLIVSMFVVWGSIKVIWGDVDKYLETKAGRRDLAYVRQEADDAAEQSVIEAVNEAN